MIQPEGSIMELCHVVGDMDKAIDHWVDVMGAGPFYVFNIPAMPGQTHRGAPTAVDLRIAFGFSGGLLIELLQQTNGAPSVFREILETKGEGYHHVMLRLPFDEGKERLERNGYGIAFAGTLPGGERFALFDTRAGNGGYIELMDLTAASFGPMEKIHAAHLAWDGKTDRKRDFFSLI
ncbi:VOC family protein [Sphingobium sp. TCM1]|uniref:VOC family protein n=1 Tax=Sphingobium sp. TCM1 TaxID=453246 RepID=UPI0007F37950|nr:VOC family protein [Sphingobium sp. TCM1]OAN56215.1 methylmalonyl-CoA mutase [Sphingobium sp. TCM1]